MRHLKSTKKFKRNRAERKRLWIDLCQALIINGQITTFTARAKWIRPFVERLVTYCKRNAESEVTALRLLRRYLPEDVAKKLYRDIAPRYKDRNGGYVAIYNLSQIYNQSDKSVVRLVE